jgi:hypothetical protein
MRMRNKIPDPILFFAILLIKSFFGCFTVQGAIFQKSPLAAGGKVEPNAPGCRNSSSIAGEFIVKGVKNAERN